VYVYIGGGVELWRCGYVELLHYGFVEWWSDEDVELSC